MYSNLSRVTVYWICINLAWKHWSMLSLWQLRWNRWNSYWGSGICSEDLLAQTCWKGAMLKRLMGHLELASWLCATIANMRPKQINSLNYHTNISKYEKVNGEPNCEKTLSNCQTKVRVRFYTEFLSSLCFFLSAIKKICQLLNIESTSVSFFLYVWINFIFPVF